MPIDVKSPDFTEAEARRATIRMIVKGETKGDPVLLAALIEAQDEEIVQLGAAVKYVAEALATFRRLVCKAAWALALPGSTGGNHTGFPEGVGAGHIHDVLNEEARDAFAELAALDTTAYAPQPADAGNLIPGTGTADVPPRYETRDGRQFGYQALHGHHPPCLHCGEPASEHPCPAVPS